MPPDGNPLAEIFADLPAAVVGAFASPNDIQFRWAGDLRQALARSESAVLARAADAALRGMPAAQVLAELLNAGATPEPKVAFHGETPPRRLDLGRGRHVEVHAKGGRVTLELDAALLPPGGWEALEKALRKITKP